MAYEGLMQDIHTIASLGVPSQVPICAMSEEFDVRWYDQGTYEDIVQDADKLAACTVAAVREFDYDWAWIQVDDCIEFEALGVGCVGSGNILRATKDYLPPTRETLDSLTMPDPEQDGRMPILLDAIRQVRAELGDTCCVTGRVAAPFSSTALLYGLTETMMLIYSDPKLLQDTNEFFIELQARFGRAQVRAGAHALWVGDCNAMSNFISIDHYTQFAFDSCQRLVTRLIEAGGITFMHASEDKVPYIAKQAELGTDILSVGPAVDIADAKSATRGQCALLGNLDPVNVLQNGTPDQVAAEAERIIKIGKQAGAYVFCSGEMVPRDTPEENMRAMLDAARRNRDYPA